MRGKDGTNREIWVNQGDMGQIVRYSRNRKILGETGRFWTNREIQ